MQVRERMRRVCSRSVSRWVLKISSSAWAGQDSLYQGQVYSDVEGRCTWVIIEGRKRSWQDGKKALKSKTVCFEQRVLLAFVCSERRDQRQWSKQREE